jgi:hypothetical protein
MADVAYYFTTSDVVNYDETDFDFYVPNRSRMALMWDGKEIVPEGLNNRLPEDLRNLLEKSHIGQGILNRVKGLQLGQGLGIYKEEYVDGYKQKNYISNPQIEAWLNSWDSTGYILKCLTDYIVRPQFYTKVYRNKGPRAGMPGKIKQLEHIPDALCRREYPNTIDKLYGEPEFVIVKDWEDVTATGYKTYPVFDKNDPWREKVSVMWTRLYQQGRNNKHEVLPQWYGATKWMQCGSNVPDVITNLNKNMLNIKWHIISPKAYWDIQRDKLMDKCDKEGTSYNEEMLEKLKDDVLKGLTKVLSGIKNVGKFFHSESVMEVLELGKTQLQEWKIIPIDQKTEEYVKSQIAIAEKADSAATSGMGLHPSLSNILINGKLASGSEMLYAYKLFLATDIWLVDTKVFEALNTAIRMNFNTTDKVGFYHDIVKREEEVTPEDRVMDNNN